MLDDLKLIHERDAQDLLGIATRQWQQLMHTFKFEGNTSFSDIQNVVYAGMGGSALAGEFVNVWPKLSVPFELIRDYELPKFVGPKTLVIVSSYSGNTEETISTLADAEA